MVADRATDVGRIELVETLTDHVGSAKAQPYHVRLVDAGNNEPMFWGETYATQRTAYDAIRWLGRLMSPVGKATTYDVRQRPDIGDESTGWLHVWLDAEELGEKIGIPIRHVFVPVEV